MNTIQRFDDEVSKNRYELNSYVDSINKAWEFHAEVIGKFPLRDNPKSIEKLSIEDLYSPGNKNYLFYYLEHKLKPLCHLSVGSDLAWRKAIEDISFFKELLKISLDEKTNLSKKIDVPWSEIKGWGGDRHAAKKLVFCYFPEKMIPILRTEHMEHFVDKLGMSEELEATVRDKFDDSYKKSTLGQKYEALTELLLLAKNQSILNSENIAIFSQALYLTFPPFPKKKK